MKAFFLAFIMAISLFCHEAKAVDDCMGDNVFTYHEGSQLIPTTTFLPAGTTAELVLKAPFDPKATYYVKFQAHYLYNRIKGGRDDVTVAQIPENSPYVQSGLANKGDSLVRINVPRVLATHWETVKVRLYGCLTDKSPAINSSVDIKVSSTRWSGFTVILSVIVLYLAAAAALHAMYKRRQRDWARAGKNSAATNSADLPKTDDTAKPSEGADAKPADARKAATDVRTAQTPPVTERDTYSFIRFVDPVVLTAGTDGRGSLAKLQILFFSVIVFGLLFYILLRTGELSDLSETVLLLLGIAAVGSTAGKGADQQKSRLDFENYAWLIKKRWLPQEGFTGISKARWGDIVTSDGEFDVYRYQSCIFSLVVGGALVVVGVNQLASFTIPTTLLGVLGLSQIVYVTGKLVAPPAFSDLNKAIATLIGLEKDLRAARTKAKVALFTDDAVRAEYEKYREAAKTTAIMFASATSLERPSDTKLEPSDDI